MMIFEIEIPDELYDLLQKRAERELRSAAGQVVHLLEKALQEDLKTLSIVELRGLGKELWAGVDPVEYIRAERDSWDRPDERIAPEAVAEDERIRYSK
jgi:hypothetical protein